MVACLAKPYIGLDSELQNKIDFVINVIANSFHPKSIMLAGSLGREEFSYLKMNGATKCLSDCEITVVPKGYIQRGALQSLSQMLSHKTQLELSVNSSLKLLMCSLIHFPYALSRKIWEPSIKYYDLKYASKVVYGENILRKLPDIQASDIPVWEGIKLMLNRMAGSLENYPENCFDNYKSIYWINKIIIACQDTLLLTIKKYHPSYKVRNEMFNQHFYDRFDKLASKIPCLLDLTAKATAFKLEPKRDAYSGNLQTLWFDVSDICNNVFRYVIQFDANISFKSWAEFPQKYLTNSNLKSQYHFEFNPFQLSNKPDGLNPFFFSSQFRLNSARQHIIYSSIPLIYFGLGRDGSVNNQNLRQARNLLSSIKQLPKPETDSFQEWNYLRQETCALWNDFLN